MNVIPLLQTKTADTAHTTGPFPNLWAAPQEEGSAGDEVAIVVKMAKWSSEEFQD